MKFYKEVVATDGEVARPNGMVLEHRRVASIKLGRNLLPGEVVHHLDGNKNNNSPDNLIVFSSRAEHTCFHGTGILVENGDGTFSSQRLPQKVCGSCGKKCNGFLCKECFLVSSRKVEWPSWEVLQGLIKEFPYTRIGSMYGVTDNAVRKWVKHYSKMLT